MNVRDSMSRDEEQSLVRWRIAEFDLMVDPKTVRQGRPDPGEVTYPVAGLLPPPLRIEIAGFTLVISRFSIFALRGFRASVSVILPPGVTDAASCGPAVIDLGRIALSPTGDYFFDEPDREYG